MPVYVPHLPYAYLLVICEKGCYISGLFIEGAGWSIEQNALVKSNNLLEPLPILRVISMEKHKLQTQVCKRCDFNYQFERRLCVQFDENGKDEG